MTWSIVARDPVTGELGIGVSSKFMCTGALIPWAKANVGAIATQSWINGVYGREGLRMLEEGLAPHDVLEKLLAQDPDRESRQVGIVDAQGRTANWTGKDCMAWAGDYKEENISCQGNVLVDENTVKATVEAFKNTKGDLADKIMAGLLAGDKAGGDNRGKESAAMLVVKEHGGWGGWTDRYLDLRVDDNPEPVQELNRLLGLHKLYFRKSDPKDLIPRTAEINSELQEMLSRLGFYSGPVNGVWTPETKESLWILEQRENLEDRHQDGDVIDKVSLEFLRKQFGK
jgi:uncharacterized Ntn-hydrolase superfamily protein